ncbi:hypothetical protein K501DRAFT_279497 [Backusella circina FSU 941]|nr:hypothetical protein K501DRAFT_279497 [Backusella circina FSU 941]
MVMKVGKKFTGFFQYDFGRFVCFWSTMIHKNIAIYGSISPGFSGVPTFNTGYQLLTLDTNFFFIYPVIIYALFFGKYLDEVVSIDHRYGIMSSDYILQKRDNLVKYIETINKFSIVSVSTCQISEYCSLT